MEEERFRRASWRKCISAVPCRVMRILPGVAGNSLFLLISLGGKE